MINRDFFSITQHSSFLFFLFCLGVITHSFSNAMIPLSTSFVTFFAGVAISLRYRRFSIITFFLTGFLWANFFADRLYQLKLDDSLIKKDVVVTGKIVGVPVIKNAISRFLFEVDSLTFSNQPFASPGIVSLRAYDHPERFKAGQCWTMQVRLRHPQSTQNPGVRLNYEKYLFVNQIRATGYVRTSDTNTFYACENSSISVARLREHIWDFLRMNFSDSDGLGILVALTLGIRSDISSQQYLVLRNTGTAHLMAISGLHIGIVSMIVIFFAGLFFRRIKIFQQLIPIYFVAIGSAVIAAFGYAMLAGMTIPTRRAFFMLLVLAVFTLVRRQKSTFELLILVLTLLLLIDPLAPLSIGFWLSFLTVVLIMVCLQKFSVSNSSGKKNFRQKIKTTCMVQLCLSVGLSPIMLLFFGYISVISPVANFISIPIIGMLVVPLALLGLILFLLNLTPIALLLFYIAIELIEFNWAVLKWLDDLNFSSIRIYDIPVVLLVLFLTGFFGLVSSRAMPARLASVLYLLPVFLFQPFRPERGNFALTMLDVGQGLSMVVQTKNHTLIYDTGPRYRTGFNAAQYVIFPFLQSRGIDHIDTLVISHEHNDHAGGYQFLRSALHIDKTISGVVQRFPGSMACKAGQKWQWDGVEFRVLWPLEDAEKRFTKGNNASCVIKISAGGGSVLLTGDIEKPVEQILLGEYEKELDIDVLQVPHQGSKTSSIMPFIDRTSPTYALFSVGYANRYHHPHNSVIRRYNQSSIIQLRTDQSGAIIVSVGNEIEVKVHRDNLIGYWYN